MRSLTKNLGTWLFILVLTSSVYGDDTQEKSWIGPKTRCAVLIGGTAVATFLGTVATPTLVTMRTGYLGERAEELSSQIEQRQANLAQTAQDSLHFRIDALKERYGESKLTLEVDWILEETPESLTLDEIALIEQAVRKVEEFLRTAPPAAEVRSVTVRPDGISIVQ